MSDAVPQIDPELIEDLIEAAREGELEPLQQFFKSHSGEKFLSVRNEVSQATPLHMAAANDHEEVVKYILGQLSAEEAKTAVNAKNDSGNTPLHWAALTGAFDCAKLLVDAGADILVTNDAGINAWDYGSRKDVKITDMFASALGGQVNEEEEEIEPTEGEADAEAEAVTHDNAAMNVD